MMPRLELLALMAASLAADGTRSIPGAVATAREILDELERAEPEAAAAHVRSRMTEALRRRERSP